MISPLKPIADFIGHPYFSGFPLGFKSHVLITSQQAGNCELYTIHNMNIFSRTRVYMTIFTFLRMSARFVFLMLKLDFISQGVLDTPSAYFCIVDIISQGGHNPSLCFLQCGHNPPPLHRLNNPSRKKQPPTHTHSHFSKVRKMVKIRKQYNQVPHLAKDTAWESNKNTKIQ